MIKSTKYKNTTVRYKVEGKGKPVVLLHGYLESLDVWNEFSNELLPGFRIVSIDLLGHGKTGNVAGVHTMEMMAEAVNQVLEKEKIDKCVMFGHSMGGYTTLAFLEKYPEKLSGFSLFHSHPFADKPATIEKRNREIRLIEQGKKNLVCLTNTTNFFALANIEKFDEELTKIKQTALSISPEGMKAVIEGMKKRKDHSQTLKNAPIPFLFIIGKHDNFIPVDMVSKIDMPQKNEVLVLENSGHIGFIEEKEKAADAVKKFAAGSF